MHIRSLDIFLAVFAIFHHCHCANILLLEEMVSRSHHLWFKKLIGGLVAGGHNVTVVTAEIDLSSENVHYICMEKVYETIYKESNLNIDIFEFSKTNPFSQISYYYGWMLDVCRGFLSSEGLQILKNYPDDFKFDLVIHDFPGGICLLSLLDKFNYPPLIFMTAFADFNFIAYTTESAVIPSLSPHFIIKEPNPTFLGRIENFLLHTVDYAYFNYFNLPACDKIVAQSFENLPPMSQLAKKSILSIFNYNAAINGVRQLPPNVIGVGGLQIEEPKNLTGELKFMADMADKGLILFSLGTAVESQLLGDARIIHILNAFANFPDYTFLWKFESNHLPADLPPNVFKRNWFPQNDILGHKNTKLFITHAGLLSTQEAIWHAVPMLTIPIIFDQFGNSYRSVKKGVAEQLLINELTTATLTEKIQLLLSDQKYKDNVAALSKAFRDQKETPLERGLWWIEWAIRNPKSVYANNTDSRLSFVYIESIDVVALFTIILIGITFVLVLAFKKFLELLLRQHKTSSRPCFDTSNSIECSKVKFL